VKIEVEVFINLNRQHNPAVLNWKIIKVYICVPYYTHTHTHTHIYIYIYIYKTSLSQLPYVYLVTPCRRMLLEKLIVPELFNKFSSFYRTDDSLPCSQQPATGSCPEIDEFHTVPAYFLSSILIRVLSSRLYIGPLRGTFFCVCAKISV